MLHAARYALSRPLESERNGSWRQGKVTRFAILSICIGLAVSSGLRERLFPLGTF